MSIGVLVLLFADGLVRLVLISVLVVMEMVLFGLLLVGLRRTDDRG
ncbi:hypothetical protein [Actinomyces sp. 2119]|nr:hypothetical protein [Actinomyces sp. 2119]